MDDLGDLVECVFCVEAEADEGDVWVFGACVGADVVDADVAGDDVMAESLDQPCDNVQSFSAFVGDEDAKAGRRGGSGDISDGWSADESLVAGPFRVPSASRLEECSGWSRAT